MLHKVSHSNCVTACSVLVRVDVERLQTSSVCICVVCVCVCVCWVDEGSGSDADKAANGDKRPYNCDSERDVTCLPTTCQPTRPTIVQLVCYSAATTPLHRFSVARLRRHVGLYSSKLMAAENF